MKINMKRKMISFHKSLFLLTMMKRKTFTAPLLARKKTMKKKKRICVKSLQLQQDSIIIPEPDFYLPDDCWEHVFTFLINQPEDKNKLNFKTLSLVSKQFLSITNRLIFSLEIEQLRLSHLSRFFHRFSNLNSLDLWFDCFYDLDADLDADVALALRHRPTLKSLSVYWFALKNYVTSYYIDSFVSLKGLNSLKFWSSQISDDLLYSIAREGLPLKSFVLEHCTGYSYHGIYGLLSKCSGIKHLGLQGDEFLNNNHISQLSLLLPDLVSTNLSGCSKLTESTLFVLTKNCHSLGEITMEEIHLARGSVENYDILKDFNVNPQLKFLHLTLNSFINNKSIILFASVFPNLELLDLRFCFNISEKGICQVLSRCCKLRHLNLACCKNVRGFKMNFAVRQLEMLNLSNTNVDDKTLYEISKSCCGLLRLSVVSCKYVTEKGVKHVVENRPQCIVIK